MSALYSWLKYRADSWACHVDLQWQIGFRADAASWRLHRLASQIKFNRELFRNRLPPKMRKPAWSEEWAATALWIAVLVWHGSREWFKWHRDIAKTVGVHSAAQIKRMIIASLVYNVSPLYFYGYALYKQENLAKAALYITDVEMGHLLPALSWANKADLGPISQKHHFADFCAVNGLNTAKTISVTGPEKEAPSSLPPVDLFLKPVNDFSGHGIEMWLYDNAAKTWRRGESSFDEAEMLDYLRSKYSERLYIVQERLVTAPDLSDLTDKALCTCRVVTYKYPDGQPEVLAASLRMPVGASEVDNVSQGGIAAPMNAATGVLGHAIAPRHAGVRYERHPRTGSLIAGRRIANWQEVASLCRRAHACVPDFAFLGWDVALADEGARLIECNVWFAPRVIQIDGHKPLGDTIFPDVFFAHWERAYGKEALS